MILEYNFFVYQGWSVFANDFTELKNISNRYDVPYKLINFLEQSLAPPYMA